VDQLKRASTNQPLPDEDPDDINNPMREPSESGNSPHLDDGEMQMSSFGRKVAKPAPSGMEGYLMKKSPALLSGWQKRYFVMQDPGEINYYDNVSRINSLLYLVFFLLW
jgi:hypothetical protein